MDTKQLEISADLDGMSVLEALSLRIIKESKTTLRRLIAEGKAQLNGKNVPLSATVRDGDTVTVPGQLDMSSPPSRVIDLDVLEEDSAHLAVNKPPGVPVLPDREGRQREFYDSLLAYVNRNARENGPYVRPHLVHRLDKQTSGVMLIGKNTSASRELSLQFQERQVEKSYIGLVEGVFPRDEYLIEMPLSRSDKSVVAMVPDEKSGKRAVTRVSVMRRFGHFTLLEMQPRTGRQHQLRVHMQSVGYPFVVDFLYGRRERFTGAALNEIVGHRVMEPSEELIDRCPLHARHIAYDASWRDAPRTSVTAPLPADIEAVLECLDDADPHRKG